MQKIVYYLVNKFFMNKAELELLNYIDKEKEDRTIFDVGCFRGDFTETIINYESKEKIKSNIFLFDPSPKVKDYLSSILKNKNVKYFNLAIDNTNSQKKFTFNQFWEPASSLHSTHKDDKWYNITRKTFMQLIQPFNKIKDYVEIIVKTKTLDDFCSENNIKYIDILKIDVNGNALNVLKGAEKLLSENKVGLIYTEIASKKKEYKNKVEEIENFLKKYNFKYTKSFKMPILSFLSGLKGSDDLFIRS